ncbi:MAG: hypothetical protein WDN03_19650 [Rhizomicrobium sp.]
MATARDDDALHKRLGVSYATNAFRAVVTALRREVLMGLLRIWDKSKGGLRLDRIASEIRKPETIQALTEARSACRQARRERKYYADSVFADVRIDLDSIASEFLQRFAKYENSGEGMSLLKKMRDLRDERLAHFDIRATMVSTKNATDEEIDEFFSDSTNLVQILRRLVLGELFDPDEAAEVHRYYAKFFWAAVRSERTEGHPNFLPAPIE